MCEMQKFLHSSFFNAKEHYLIHQVEEIELCGPIHIRSLWMVERHLKFFKALVRQRARPGGSMVEGYMVYQAMVYITEYLPGLAFIKIVLDQCIGDPKSYLTSTKLRPQIPPSHHPCLLGPPTLISTCN
jgi:hypothetical protein